jgi:hypothetical protein
VRERRRIIAEEENKVEMLPIGETKAEPRDIMAELTALREAVQPKAPVIKGRWVHLYSVLWTDLSMEPLGTQIIFYPKLIFFSCSFLINPSFTYGCLPITSSEAPVLDLLTGDQYRLKPGNNLRVGVRVSSGARATVNLLSAAGHELTGSTLGRCRIEQFGDDFYLNLRNLNPSDAGTYTVQAENVAGKTAIPIKLFVSTEPLAPTGPLMVNVVEPASVYGEGATVELSWKPPVLRPEEIPEYAEPVLGYCVERREGQRRVHFGYPIRLEGPNQLSAQVRDLKPGVEYVFRVTATNAVGVSEPLYSEPIVIKTPFGR